MKTLIDSASFGCLVIQKNLKTSLSRPVAFGFQVILMMINNLLYFSMWHIFFHRFKEINGWSLPELKLLFGLVMGAFGFSMVLGGGIRSIARKINRGDIEGIMTQPRSVLFRLVTAESSASGWGDVLTSVFLLSTSEFVGLKEIPLAIFFVMSGTLLFIAMGVVIYSLAFWLGQVDTLTFQLFEFVLTFSVYPQSVFTGMTKYLIFTFVPAGFIGYLPVEVIKSFSISQAGLVFGSIFVYGGISMLVFRWGMKRYQS